MPHTVGMSNASDLVTHLFNNRFKVSRLHGSAVALQRDPVCRSAFDYPSHILIIRTGAKPNYAVLEEEEGI